MSTTVLLTIVISTIIGLGFILLGMCYKYKSYSLKLVYIGFCILYMVNLFILIDCVGDLLSIFWYR
jgi:hypothetical protein